MMRIIATLALIALATLNLETPVRLDGADREWWVRRVIGVECANDINRDSDQIQRAVNAAGGSRSTVEFTGTCYLARPIDLSHSAGISITGGVFEQGFDSGAVLSVRGGGTGQ